MFFYLGQLLLDLSDVNNLHVTKTFCVATYLTLIMRICRLLCNLRT